MFITIEIQGITPLICNRFTDEAAMASTNGDRGSSAGMDRGTPLEIAASKLYVGADGKPMIPSPNLLRSIVDGGAHTKLGKKQVTTARSSLLYACLSIEAAEVEIINEQPWKVDTRPVRIPSTGGRILCHRPMFDDWKLAFEVELDTTILNAKPCGRSSMTRASASGWATSGRSARGRSASTTSCDGPSSRPSRRDWRREGTARLCMAQRGTAGQGEARLCGARQGYARQGRAGPG